MSWHEIIVWKATSFFRKTWCRVHGHDTVKWMPAFIYGTPKFICRRCGSTSDKR